MKKLIYIGLCMLTCGIISATPLKAEAAEIPDKNTNESEELLSAGIGDFFSDGLTEEDYRNGLFTDCRKELAGNNECLNLSHPEIIKSIHQEYIAAGADIIETNTFSANAISRKSFAESRNCADSASISHICSLEFAA